MAVLESTGYCPTCCQQVVFRSNNEWLRDHFLCTECGSIPRERALMAVIESRFPDWRQMTIHESSPARRGASQRMASECTQYIPSQYYADVPMGTAKDGFRCENLEALSFADQSIDLHVTQDVMEHIFDFGSAFREIARTLKPGGAHVFTVPLVRKHLPSVLRSRVVDSGQVEFVLPPIYHGNPISDQGSLVTVDWGFDICSHIFKESGLFTEVVCIDDLSRGIRAEYIEVLLTRKPSVGDLGLATPEPRAAD